MSSITFDTLALADKLEKSGFTAEQAKGTAQALSGALSEGTVTPQHLDLRLAELKADILRLEGVIRESEQRVTIRLGTMMAVAVAVVAALVKLL